MAYPGTRPIHGRTGGGSSGYRRSQFGNTSYRGGPAVDANAADIADAEGYRKALEKAVYGSLGPAFSQGLQGLQGFLSTAGPLADSGARAALGARLASRLYGAASGQVGQGYAAYLADLIRQRRGYQYQKALIKASKPGIIQTLAGAAGGYLGGGGKVPSFGGGGAGTFGSDSLYYG